MASVFANSVTGHSTTGYTLLFYGTNMWLLPFLQHIVQVLRRAEVKDRLFNAGAEAVGNTPEQFAAIVKSDMARLGRVIRDAGIRAE